jgi:hypothetical protein
MSGGERNWFCEGVNVAGFVCVRARLEPSKPDGSNVQWLQLGRESIVQTPSQCISSTTTSKVTVSDESSVDALQATGRQMGPWVAMLAWVLVAEEKAARVLKLEAGDAG